jgi:hypothetical protein
MNLHVTAIFLLMQATAVAYGLTKEQALQAITLNGAKILPLMIVPVRLKK